MTSTHSSAHPSYAKPRPPSSPSAPPSVSLLPGPGSRSLWADRARVAVWLVPAVLVAYAGFQRRWMSDDAYVYVRTVRQVLAGNGPVFNAGERVESSTGTLWQWLLVAAGAVGVDPVSAAVLGGLLLTAAGFALAGTRGAADVRRADGRAAGVARAARAAARVGLRHLGS